MNFEHPDLIPALPEIFVLTMACVVLLVDVYRANNGGFLTYLLTQATLFGALILTVSLHATEPQLTFGDTFVRDSMGDVLKIFIYVVSFVAFLYSRQYLRERNLLKGEYFVLGLFAVLGMMVMVSAYSLLVVYLGLELLSLALYAMVALNRDSLQCSEAAMKYFVLGALASGMLLYGMSLIYGVTGTLNMKEISAHVAMGIENAMVMKLGVALLVVGVAFKLGSVPFHMWVPDVYHGAPTSVTLFIGTAPKLAAFGMMMRLLVDGVGGLHVEWQTMLIVLAMLSIAVGNVVAIAQTNIKRMLAYSTISHMGFLLLGMLTGTGEGYSSAMFYAIVYAVMGLGGFGMVILLSRAGFEAENLEDFRGLNERSPWFAFMMLLLMFSMAGVPPTVGFFAKLAVLEAAVQAGLTWLAVFAVIFSVVGAFYYLRIVKLMYFDRAVDVSPVEGGTDMRVVLSLNGVAVLLLGMFPGALMALCHSVLT
jgi:NADH-quinone oxidoreductase subunit N